jgi:peptidoglycan/LPS O-acetylase OafA/YrhL
MTEQLQQITDLYPAWFCAWIFLATLAMSREYALRRIDPRGRETLRMEFVSSLCLALAAGPIFMVVYSAEPRPAIWCLKLAGTVLLTVLLVMSVYNFIIIPRELG